MVDIIGSYKKMILSLMPDNLKKQLAKEKGSLGQAIIYILLTALVADIVVIISMLLSLGSNLAGLGMGGGENELAMAGFLGVTGIVVMAVYVIAIPIIMIFWAFIQTGVMWVLAKILGGKGSFTSQLYHFSIVGGGLTLITSLLSLIPCLGGLIAMVLGFYYLYPVYLVYKGVHQLSSGRAIALVLLPIVLLILLFVIIMILFAAAFASLLGALGAGGGFA
ncbi:MAG TPA: YIP1 family protein [Candidatus Bilamarchaeaceae archaeon]|nr:YIP1 family protein [Candidatus Bilamarchaeaceae archaeon]